MSLKSIAQSVSLCRNKITTFCNINKIAQSARVEEYTDCIYVGEVRFPPPPQRVSWVPVRQGYTIQRLHVCRGLRLPQRVSVTQSAGAAEYTDSIFALWQDSPNKCPVVKLAWAVEYTHCNSAEGMTPPTSVLDMTLKNLIACLYKCWNFGKWTRKGRTSC